jgi:glycosyltransferase involved in cell wall biosynthesis
MEDEFPSTLRDEKILLASESLGPINGVSRTTTNLILSLQAQGVDLKLVAPQYINSGAPLPYGYVRRLGGMALPYTPELSVAYPFRLDRISANFKPTLVYLASPASVGFQAMLQLRCMINPPLVMANFQTDLSAYASVILPAPLDRYSVWLLQVVQGWLYNFEAVHTIFYPSSPVKQYLIEAGVPQAKLVHLGRGVDTQLFHPIHRDEDWRKELAPNGEIILVVVGRLAPEKGFPFLAEVAIALAEAGVQFKLVIVGGNRNASVEADIRAAFDPVGDKVVFTGFLEGTQLARAYATADIFVHCSVTETFGLVVLEAMSCGLPVVARDAGGPSEIVRDGTSGFLTAPDDMVAFVDRVRYLAIETGLRAVMSRHARAQAEDTTWDKINLRVAQRMAAALEERRKKPARRPLDLGNQTLNWIAAFFSAIYTEMLFSGAMLIVSFFWIIAVVPLMVHGNIVFSSAKRPATGSGTKAAVLSR